MMEKRKTLPSIQWRCGSESLVLSTTAARHEAFFVCCVHARMNTSIVLSRKKGQAHFTNNVLIDPLLVMLFLCLPTQRHTIENERDCDCCCMLGPCAFLSFPFKAASQVDHTKQPVFPHNFNMFTELVEWVYLDLDEIHRRFHTVHTQGNIGFYT